MVTSTYRSIRVCVVVRTETCEYSTCLCTDGESSGSRTESVCVRVCVIVVIPTPLDFVVVTGAVGGLGGGPETGTGSVLLRVGP